MYQQLIKSHDLNDFERTVRVSYPYKVLGCTVVDYSGQLTATQGVRILILEAYSDKEPRTLKLRVHNVGEILGISKQIVDVVTLNKIPATITFEEITNAENSLAEG